MRNYSWVEFQGEKYFEELKSFFNKEIFSYKGETKKPVWDSVVFVSRKAYCLFLLLEAKGVIQENGCSVYSDRYIMKTLDSDLFQGQKVCLVDDTITTGKHMADVYDIIKRKVHKSATVTPKVFVGEKNFKNEETIKCFEKENKISIEPCALWDASELLKFCSIETLIMHQEGIPYAIELPVVSEEGKSYIALSKEQFEKLTMGSEEWAYLECNQTGYLQNNIQYGVMVMRSNSVAESMANLVFKFCVRIQVTMHESEYRIVAMPFAVLKSVRIKELYGLFQKIYGGTEYGEQMERYISEQDEFPAEDIYVAIYRGIVFNLGEYIGRSFIGFLNREILPSEMVDFSTKNQHHNFEQSFCRSTKDIFEKNYRDYLITLILYDDFTCINANDNRDLMAYLARFRGLTCDFRTVSLFLLVMINEIRFQGVGSNGLDIASNQRNKFITIEDMQNILYKTYPYESRGKLDDLLLMCVCSMLGQSKLANEIYYDKKKDVIYRGFKYGENSEALLDLSAKIFYVAVREYYNTSIKYESEDNPESLYSKNYERFLSVLKLFIMEYQLNDMVITSDELRLYAEFFRERDRVDLKRVIENIQFIGEDEKRPHYLERLKGYITASDIYV